MLEHLLAENQPHTASSSYVDKGDKGDKGHIGIPAAALSSACREYYFAREKLLVTHTTSYIQPAPFKRKLPKRAGIG